MRIISIESPQQLKDGTVKASIVVAEENYIPLILLKVRAQKGDAIEIDDAGEENIPAYEFDQIVPIIRIIQDTIEQREKEAERVGYQKAKKEIEKESV